MTIKKCRKSVYYVTKCNICGKEIEVDKDDINITCYDCITKIAVEKAEKKLSFLIGAKIINVVVCENGSYTDDTEIDSICVETDTGIKIVFQAGGWEEHYIEWSDK